MLRFVLALLALVLPLLARAKDAAGAVPSPSQRAEYEKDFRDFDSNGDLFLDAQEIRSGFKGRNICSPHKRSTVEDVEMINSCDTTEAGSTW